MWSFVIAICVFVATTLQTLVAIVDMREAHRPAIEVAKLKEQLVQELPRFKRRRWRKEIRTWRDNETERSLAYVDLVAFSWTLLVFASGIASVQASIDLF